MPTGRGQSKDVIPSLMDVLSKAVSAANKDHVDLRPLTKGLGRGGQRLSEKQVKRYLDGDPPPGSKIDGWARVVAGAIGERDHLVFWDRALRQAKAVDSGELGGEKSQAHRR